MVSVFNAREGESYDILGRAFKIDKLEVVYDL
jgi:hypothetical protein